MSPIRAWWNLLLLSFRRQARMRLMIWIALGLLALSIFITALNTAAGRWNMGHRRLNWGGKDQTYRGFVEALEKRQLIDLWNPTASAIHLMHAGALRVVLDHASGFFVFSNTMVFSLFTTFLLPLFTLSFASDALGREREGHTLLWLLTRPLPRPALYLATFLAALPWCLLLNLGGFALMCLAAGPPGRLAFQLYWPAVVAGTLAFAALFHFLGAWLRRAAIVAMLYAFFIETVMGNLPGHLKRLSISFYTRCMMFDRAHDFGIAPERPEFYLPVSGPTAIWILVGIIVGFLGFGMLWFSRKEYLDEI